MKAKARKATRGPSPSTSAGADTPFEETAASRARRTALSDPCVKSWLFVNGLKDDTFVKRAHLVARIEAFQARGLGHDLPLCGFSPVSQRYP